jgi:hypothetical protein
MSRHLARNPAAWAAGIATASLALAAVMLASTVGCSQNNGSSTAGSDAGEVPALTSQVCSAPCFAGELCLWQDNCGVGGVCEASPPITEKCISAAPCNNCNCLTNDFGFQQNCGGCAFNPEAGYFFMYCWTK